MSSQSSCVFALISKHYFQQQADHFFHTPSKGKKEMCIECMHLSWWPNGKESACRWKRLWFNSWVGSSPGEGNDNPLQYSCLENPIDRGAPRVTVHGSLRVKHDLVTKQQQKNKVYIKYGNDSLDRYLDL